MIKGSMMGKLQKGDAKATEEKPEQMEKLVEAAKELKIAVDAHDKKE